MTNKKECFISLRVSEEEKAHIKALASELYMPVSNFIFMCIDEHINSRKGDKK